MFVISRADHPLYIDLRSPTAQNLAMPSLPRHRSVTGLDQVEKVVCTLSSLDQLAYSDLSQPLEPIAEVSDELENEGLASPASSDLESAASLTNSEGAGSGTPDGGTPHSGSSYLSLSPASPSDSLSSAVPPDLYLPSSRTTVSYLRPPYSPPPRCQEENETTVSVYELLTQRRGLLIPTYIHP